MSADARPAFGRSRQQKEVRQAQPQQPDRADCASVRAASVLRKLGAMSWYVQHGDPASSISNMYKKCLAIQQSPQADPARARPSLHRRQILNARVQLSSQWARGSRVARYNPRQWPLSSLPLNHSFATRPRDRRPHPKWSCRSPDSKPAADSNRLRRSHSQADSRGGRPKRSRKPSCPTCGSASCCAVVSAGTSGNCARTPVAAVRPRPSIPPHSTCRGIGMREVVAVGRIPFIGRECRLINTGVGDGPHQMLQIEIMIHEVFGQRIQQRRVRRRVGGPDIVHRIDDALAQKITPNPVGDRLGEKRIVLRR